MKAFLRLVAIEHSVFALPFAYLSAIIAGASFWDIVLITIAMVGARTFAMAANRIIDRHIDARNPRTAKRELVTGAVSVRTAWIGAIIALVVFFAAALALNWLCFFLSPLAVIPLVVYPYAKRFTNWPHLVLAIAQAVGPIGAWLAVTGSFAGSGPAWLLGAAVGLWIGGFDLIYACQDAEIDREIGVHSVPSRFGVPFALRLSTQVHALTFALFVYFGLWVGLAWPWYVGLLLAGAAFVYQHVIVTPTDLSKVNRAFFTANGFVGIVLFAFGLVAWLIR
ncbi:4-hydroxybenzoate octaprenyltransferase [Rhizocola hellebori]|uniref:4-hydroxybenzoate polyprenyltransferase n=1 Tax=Rhizocola hellebori TaxID=1392758 RepID=A0A8J3VKV1_9ACTN|nr:menaquinone biosynthesis prenyltransferase MqnP [Rhizocola hellebori]GIH09416.1 4-hydroxybenzoate octaprenyltransferase [Rhizocola hellebori]